MKYIHLNFTRLGIDSNVSDSQAISLIRRTACQRSYDRATPVVRADNNI